MKTKYILFALAGLVIAGFGYYALSPLLRNVRLDEALPMNFMEKKEAGAEAEPAAREEDEREPFIGERFPIKDTPLHPAEGYVRIIEAEGKTYVRYEEYKTINGPDLFVYLAKDLDAKEFVNLGELKATEGNINYEVPEDVNIEEYPYVLTWCKAFGVLFNSAKIN